MGATRVGYHRTSSWRADGGGRTATPALRIEDLPILNPSIIGLAVALGIGLLIGGERERRKGDGPSRSPAGIRTFALVSLAGAVSRIAGGEGLLAVATAGVIALAVVAYLKTPQGDPGLTSEVALVLTAMLGGLAVAQPALAASAGVAVAVLLSARTQIHHFVRAILTEDEVRDGFILAAATLIVLPLLPDQSLGPYGALNPRNIWVLVILVMAIGAAGYIAVRFAGVRFGLPIAGLASGFISSTATIGALGARAAKAPDVLEAAVAGAVLSTVATVVQMALVLFATSLSTLEALAWPLISAGITASCYGAFFTFRALRQMTEQQPQPGHAFSISAALLFALTLSVILVITSAFQNWFGETGAVAAAIIAGFIDTHAPAISIAALVAAGKMTPADAVVPILAAFSTNAISKSVLASVSGGKAFTLRVVPGVVLVSLSAWVAALVALPSL